MQPRIGQVMSGFPRLFADIPYIAQCAGRARGDRKPGYLSKASLLTSTQSVIRPGALKTPAPPPATSAQLRDSPAPSSVASSTPAAKIQGPISAAHGRSMEPAQPPTSIERGIQKLGSSPVSTSNSASSRAATNLDHTSEGKPAATATGDHASSLRDELVPEAPAITISGAAVPLAPSATAIALDSHIPPLYITPAPSIVATPTNVPIATINGQTLIPGASSPRTITIMNMPVHASGSYIIYGTSTSTLSAVTSTIPHASVFTLQASALVISSQTLMPGGSVVTLGSGSGTTRILSLESGGSRMVVVSEGQGTTSTTIEQLSGFFGQSLVESGAATQTPSLQTYTGSGARSDGHRGLIVGIVAVMACYRVFP
jgi:hypothetical protein